MASYQNGGWYVHPGSNGKSQQYWNGQWYDTPQQNGGGGNNNSGGGATLYGGTPLSAIQGPAVKPFGWSTDQWNKAQQDALAKLTPYYKQLLDLNNGDVNRAKTALEADYATGVRFNTADYQNQMSQENIQEGDEMRQTLDDLNSRGVLFQETAPGQQPNQPRAQGQEGSTPTTGTVTDYSGMQPTATQTPMDSSQIAGSPAQMSNPAPGKSYSGLATTDYFDPLLDKQQQRRNAIKNAIQKTTSTASNDFVQNLGDQNSQQTEKQLSLGEQESQQAMQMAQDQYQHEADVAQGANTGSVQPFLDTSSANVVGGGK